MAPPFPLNLPRGAHSGDEEEDAEFGSVISASLVSAPSSESTAVYSYLEELKKFPDHSEEAKSIQRFIANRELRRQAKTLSCGADELSAKLLRAKAARKAPASPGSSTLSANTREKPMAANSRPALTESSVRLADSTDRHANCDEQLWRRRLELSMPGAREDPFPIGPTPASLQQQQAWRHSELADEDLLASRRTPPRSEGAPDTSEEPSSDEELWKERLRLYLDSAPTSTCHISSCAPSRLLPADIYDDEDWEDFRSSLTSSLDTAKTKFRGSKEVNAPSTVDGVEGREQEPRARPRFCSLFAAGLALAVPVVISALPEMIASAQAPLAAMW